MIDCPRSVARGKGVIHTYLKIKVNQEKKYKHPVVFCCLGVFRKRRYYKSTIKLIKEIFL